MARAFDTKGAGARPRAHVTVPRGVPMIDHAVAQAAAPVQQGTTQHFVVSYDSALGTDGAALADAILARCEADYATLQAYFGGITPPNIPFQVLITTDDTGAYHFGCAGTALYIGGRSASSGNTAAPWARRPTARSPPRSTTSAPSATTR